MIKVSIKYLTRNRKYKEWIKENCNIPPYETLNGTVEFYIPEDKMNILLEAESKGVIKVMSAV